MTIIITHVMTDDQHLVGHALRVLGHAEFDLPRLGDLHHPSPNVCQAAVEGDLE